MFGGLEVLIRLDQEFDLRGATRKTITSFHYGSKGAECIRLSYFILFVIDMHLYLKES